MNVVAALLFYFLIALSLNASVFPKTVEEIEQAFENAKTEATRNIDAILAIPKEARTFENTIKAFDQITANFDVPYLALSTLGMVHPDPLLRAKAKEVLSQFEEFMIDTLESNRAIYEAFMQYQPEAHLSDEARYHLDGVLEGFKRDGFGLNEKDFARMIELSKHISALSNQFYTNISTDRSSLNFTREQLIGVDEAFIDSLERDGELYVLYANRPTHDKVLSKCHLEATRKAYFHLYTNWASPYNLDILQNIIKARHELATLLGHTSYAEMDLKGQMADSPATVQQFLDDMAEVSKASSLWHDERINSWDSLYLADQYKMKHLQVDQDKVSEYFPFEHTFQSMLSIMGKFLAVKFTIIQNADLWHPDAILAAVRDLNGNAIGNIIFDLFPRAGKYTHCLCMSVVNRGNGGLPLAVVLANLTKPCLSHANVVTLFHEFGHAIHAITGKAELPTKCGDRTLHDFVEVPSQFFEEFASDPEILTQLSSHYITGEPLSDDLISRIIKAKNINDGSSATLSSEIFYSLVSLQLFNGNQDIAAIEKRILPWLIPDPDDNSLATFEHLINYGAKYYTYLWSKVLAEKLYKYVKSHGGPQDPLLGKRYIEKIVGRGGSTHPDILIQDFLLTP